MPEPDSTPQGIAPSEATYRVGIIGGMGPMAGVYLQQLIIEATPAARDQDHLQVVCFTNPHVPERMRSLAEDGGRRYAAAVRATGEALTRAGATHLAMACNTAHARLAEIQHGLTVPIVDMVNLAIRELVETHGTVHPVGLLATVGTLSERVYETASASTGLRWIVPEAADQARVVRAILTIKTGRLDDARDELGAVARALVAHGAGLILVGCTELSMCLPFLAVAGVPLVDPLRILARHLVALGLADRAARRVAGTR